MESGYRVEEDLIQNNEKVYIISETQLNNKDYQYRVVNSAGQTVELVTGVFYKDEYAHKQYWAVTLSVNKKSKGYEFGKNTGKSGIESLLIAKKIFQYHIDKHIISWPTNTFENIMIIWWDDAQRRNVYERGLRDMGFQFGQFAWKQGYNTGKCLYKKYQVKDKCK